MGLSGEVHAAAAFFCEKSTRYSLHMRFAESGGHCGGVDVDENVCPAGNQIALLEFMNRLLEFCFVC